MSPEIRRKLVGVLGMLGSNHDGERSAAGLLATKLLRNAGVTWEEVIVEKPLVVHRNASPPQPWRATAAFCLEQTWQLTAWELQFLQSLQSRRAISPKQTVILERIHDKVRGCR